MLWFMQNNYTQSGDSTKFNMDQSKVTWFHHNNIIYMLLICQVDGHGTQ